METLVSSVADGIDRAVRNFPDNDALTTSRRTISYREFGDLVDHFAGQLAVRTSPGEFVGIDASRRIGAIVGMIGALKADRPFVFIDSRDSVSSNSDKVRLLGVRLLAGPSPHGATGFSQVPYLWRPAAGTVAPGPPPIDGLGYAIHTSGSTGRPKCVLVRTQPLAAVIRDHVERLDVGPGDTTLQFARLTFDGCLTEILWTLTAGARLVLLDPQHLAPGAVLASTVERFGITHLKTTPFALTATEPSSAMRLKHVINGGGACRPAVVRKWSAISSFHNAYGLTETTVCNLLTGALEPAGCAESVPLGDLVGDCDYRIDGAGTQRGELVITGNSVAAGYLTGAGLELFDDGEYHTGDLVELRGGQLHFVERLDRQVKVRGYRIDPGEVENSACHHPAVREAVVLTESHDGADDSAADALVCYYQGEVDPRTLRQHLQRRLDRYKVPSVLTRVDVFPYTPNGKVDRDALRASRKAAPSPARAGDDGPFSPGEEVLRLVRSVTGVADIHLDDNFFDVGGDSASAVVLVAKLKELGWVDAGVRDVLRATDLRALVGAMREHRG